MILGLDLGQHSIGWALIDSKENTVVNSGVTTRPLVIKSKRVINGRAIGIKEIFRDKIRHRIYLAGIICLTCTLLVLGILDKNNWQFWISMGVPAVFTLLAILHSEVKKK